MSKPIATPKSPRSSRQKALPVSRAKSSAPAAKSKVAVVGASRTQAAQSAKVKATTLRLRPTLQQGLELLQVVLKKPINKLVNEAVAGFIEKRTAEVEVNLTGVLAQIKAYKRADPKFEHARARFVDAEALHGSDDPVEGVVVDVEPSARKPRQGPALKMVQDLLRS
jgi:hypothetical protein